MKRDLKIIEGDEVISVNDRKRLLEMKKEYPNLEIILGKVEETDKPISLDLAEMESSRTKILDAATESIMGKRIDKLETPPKFPTNFVIAAVFFMLGVGVTYIFYNIW